MTAAHIPADVEDLLGAPVADIVPESALADLLGLSTRRVRDLAADNVIPRAGPALYERRTAVRAYCEWIRVQASKGRGSTPPELQAEKIRLTREQADAVATKNALARGELLAAGDVERTWARILRDVRAAMLAVPSRVSARAGHLSASDLRLIDNEIRDALREAADG